MPCRNKFEPYADQLLPAALLQKDALNTLSPQHNLEYIICMSVANVYIGSYERTINFDYHFTQFARPRLHPDVQTPLRSETSALFSPFWLKNVGDNKYLEYFGMKIITMKFAQIVKRNNLEGQSHMICDKSKKTVLKKDTDDWKCVQNDTEKEERH